MCRMQPSWSSVICSSNNECSTTADHPASSRRFTASRVCPNGDAPAMNGCGSRIPRYEVEVSMIGPFAISALRIAHVDRSDPIDGVLHRFLLRLDQLGDCRGQHPAQRVFIGVKGCV